ncbi:putative ATP-dependent protease [uncultured delta proteobacterium]|uniref:endopeptidase La n=1 Tax=uncultured delta proteobacterium TaxID=34034 RepID=A0A212J9K0_9DELT|nr:putative ATP-dependent protease [uncultured delta proteobacterium]
MKTFASLTPDKLRPTLDPARIPYATSEAIPRTSNHRPPQPRALQALELAINVKDNGYNIYLSGVANLGRTRMVRDFLRPHCKKAPTPPDILYVNNFDDPDSPRLISVPAGQGKKLKRALAETLARIRKDIPMRFEHEAFTRRRSGLLTKFQNRKDKLFREMDVVAGNQGFNLDMDDGGSMTLYPLVEGKRLSEQEFNNLESAQRKELKAKGDNLVAAMSGLVRKFAKMEQAFLDDERSLEKEVAAEVLDRLLTPLVEKFCAACPSKVLAAHFADLRAHIVENLDLFLAHDAGPFPGQSGADGSGSTPFAPFSTGPDMALHGDDALARYEINLFVDNSNVHGAPLVSCDHPTTANLMGSIERESEMGALVTDFSLIKAGMVHKANGGYLLLRVEDLLQYPNAWESLLRALRSGIARIEDAGDGENVKTKGISPEPVPLHLKIILIGVEEIYETLLLADERFAKLFKVKAQLTEHMPRNARGVRIYLSHIRRIVEEAELLHFDKDAMAGLIDVGSNLIEDNTKLSLKFPLLREIMIEASATAKMQGCAIVTGTVLRETMKARTFRVNLVEESFMEEYDRGVIKVETKGEAVGRVNGLSVTWYGDFEFGLPHRIAATVGVGHDGIIDLEREAKLGGPIHTKAMLILKSYLVGQFARNKPLVLSGSLCFEQSYAGIEGDSASGAELAALLSALADTPINLALALTGAVSQSGNILAVGGVTRKIEGFFEVCRRHGLTGGQGVIMPRDNLEHIMLNDGVTAAVAAGQFHIYPVAHITEAMELLTGMPAGKRRKDGSFTKGTLYDRVDKRLAELCKLAAKARRP